MWLNIIMFKMPVPNFPFVFNENILNPWLAKKIVFFAIKMLNTFRLRSFHVRPGNSCDILPD